MTQATASGVLSHIKFSALELNDVPEPAADFPFSDKALFIDWTQ
jgi:hypothetical protein